LVLLTGIILAGGESSRMGIDKALINSNVERLASEMRSAGCNRIIVMCGTDERAEMFSEECVTDSKPSLAESILDLLATLDGAIQLASCDAYLADADLFSKINGVPLDDSGIRQPLLAKFDISAGLNHSSKITEMFENIPSCEGGIKARNVNTPDEFKAIEQYLD